MTDDDDTYTAELWNRHGTRVATVTMRRTLQRRYGYARNGYPIVIVRGTTPYVLEGVTRDERAYKYTERDTDWIEDPDDPFQQQDAAAMELANLIEEHAEEPLPWSSEVHARVSELIANLRAAKGRAL